MASIRAEIKTSRDAEQQQQRQQASVIFIFFPAPVVCFKCNFLVGASVLMNCDVGPDGSRYLLVSLCFAT